MLQRARSSRAHTCSLRRPQTSKTLAILYRLVAFIEISPVGEWAEVVPNEYIRKSRARVVHSVFTTCTTGPPLDRSTDVSSDAILGFGVVFVKKRR